MATAIDPTQFLEAAKCSFQCIPPGMIWYAVLAALSDVANGDPVPTDTNEIIDEARCLSQCIPPGFLPYAILAAVSNISGGGGGGAAGAIPCTIGIPVAAPSSSCALAIDSNDGTIYEYYNGAWH